jgi:hypothetical protein
VLREVHAVAHSYPADFISFDEAFTRTLCALLGNGNDVRVITTARATGGELAKACGHSDEDDASRKRVRSLLCDAFTNGELKPFIKEPNGRIEVYHQQDWSREPFSFGAPEISECLSAPETDDRPRLLKEIAFEEWLSAQAGVSERPEGKHSNGDPGSTGCLTAQAAVSEAPEGEHSNGDQSSTGSTGWMIRRAPLTIGERAIWEVVKSEFPQGTKGCKPSVRNERIYGALRDSNCGLFGPSTIKRFFQKVVFIDPK